MARRLGVANLPLHGGRAPRWLFERMVRLSQAIVFLIVDDYGPEEFLRRLADPFWFQALGCVLGFDWHSSGITTTVCGALKLALKDAGREVGLFVCGGKGATSRKTPLEIETICAKEALPQEFRGLVEASRLSAKVDNTALQDGYTLYHHSFFFTRSGLWAVVQQGMNETTAFARRYHWLGERVRDFTCEPHAAICAQEITRPLNLVARESESARKSILALAREHPEANIRALKRIKTLNLPARHHLSLADLWPRGLEKVLIRTYEEQPHTFERLLSIKGLGPKALRALSLTAEIIHGVSVSRRDPARYAFAHGGKDGHPFPVDRKIYDQTTAFLEDVLTRARLGDRERREALRRLSQLRLFQP
ncbi:DUF763 domain-containing protein [Thermosulfuriphilus sp.]